MVRCWMRNAQLSRNTVGPCPKMTQATGLPGTALKEETLYASVTSRIHNITNKNRSYGCSGIHYLKPFVVCNKLEVFTYYLFIIYCITIYYLFVYLF